MQALTEAQIIENLHPYYRSMYREIVRQRVYSGEQVFYAADCTGNQEYLSLIEYGFMIFTNQRYLEVFDDIEKVAGVSYFKSGSNWDKILGQKVDDRRWIELERTYREPDRPRSKLPDCRDSAYSDIKGIIRNDHAIRHKNEHIPLVELRFDLHLRYGKIYRTFRGNDGAVIFDLLNLAIQNGGKLPIQLTDGSSESSDTEVVRLIKALGDLRKAGILTDTELEQKKRELLGKL